MLFFDDEEKRNGLQIPKDVGVSSQLTPTISTVPSPSLIFPEDSKEAKKVFNSLSLQHQLDSVLRARGKERLHTLFLSESPEQLVQRLPELEIFLTVKEVGEKDAHDLISLTTPEQFQYLLDLDLWKKDQLDPEKILQWMEILLECGEEKVAQFVYSTDIGSIALLLKKFIYVRTLEGEPLEARDRIPLFTLDQHYFIDFEGKGSREFFQPFLEILYRVDAQYYQRLMEALVWELESELEEGGYRLRNGRMSDYGFPDFEESLEIYRFIHPDSLRSEGKIPLTPVEQETEKGSPTFYLTFQKEGPFFSSILAKVEDPSEINRLKYEITALCNKAMIAEAMDQFTLEAMKQVTSKVFHYLNLGLQYLSQEEETKGLQVLRSHPIQKIFQCGISTTLLLKRKIEAIFNGPWFEGDRENLSFLDSPFLERFGGILRKRPAIYRDGKFENFKDLQDLKEVESFLKLIEVPINFLRKRLNVSPRSLREMDLTGCYPEEWRGISFSTIFLTALANQILRGTFKFEAIEKAKLKDLFSHIFEKDGEGEGVMRMEIRKGFRDWLGSMEDDENRRQDLLAFQDFCLDLFEEEYKRIPPEEEIDPRFVRGLLIRI